MKEKKTVNKREQLEEKAVDIMRNKMTDKDFWDYAKDFLVEERVAEDISSYFRDIAEDKELKEFIKKYNTK